MKFWETNSTDLIIILLKRLLNRCRDHWTAIVAWAFEEPWKNEDKDWTIIQPKILHELWICKIFFS